MRSAVWRRTQQPERRIESRAWMKKTAVSISTTAIAAMHRFLRPMTAALYSELLSVAAITQKCIAAFDCINLSVAAEVELSVQCQRR